MLMYLIALLPVLGWGLMPIIANLKKSNPEEQLLGTSISALLFSVVLFIIIKPEISGISFCVSFISGGFWSIGQLLQFTGIRLSSVSKAMPVSNGTQLTFTTLFAVLIFNEWKTVNMMLIGIMAILIIIIGITLTSYQKKQSKITTSPTLSIYLILSFSSLFLSLYVVINQLFSVSGFAIILPQSIGMLCSALLIYKFTHKGPSNIQNISFNFITGFVWSFANLGMFLTSIQLGVATSFSISQACVIVATIGGILIFKEKKQRLEWIIILSGISLIMLGVTLLSLLK
ncbi:GRP family sugar transporter [Peribacillus loiseleuriae]|uniref:Sugar transporter n=1 Tax=Peribacillus loiseleuriae TaxID=1679170 RepID=A0A0K9GSU5_9BACI|nr:GRP family sugar transporter [Peribacillus loiseleuriae]KMY49713.1 sugar transporter [Peribacillus loiseleuriae]